MGIKVFGDDFDILVQLSDLVQQILSGIQGASDVAGEQITGQPLLRITVNQDQIARYGIPARNVLDLVASVGTRQVGDIFEGQRRFPLVVRLPNEQRTNILSLANTLIPTKSGQLLPIRQLV